MIRDFPKLQISETHWLDVRRCFKDGKFNRNHVLEIFTKYSDMEVDNLQEHVLQLVEQDTKYWTHVSNVVLSMKAINFETWLSMMKIPICAIYELMLFMLCKIHDCHTMVFTDTKLWTMVEEGHQLSLDELYSICNIHLLYLRQDMYGELKSLFCESRNPNLIGPSSISKTVVAGKTSPNVPMLTNLCQEALKQIGTKHCVQSSCTPLLKPAMENYLSEHPHLLKALGLTKTLPITDTITEVILQQDLDIINTSEKAEDPELGQTLPVTVNPDPTKTNPVPTKKESKQSEPDPPASGEKVTVTDTSSLNTATKNHVSVNNTRIPIDVQVDTDSRDDNNNNVSLDYIIALALIKKSMLMSLQMKQICCTINLKLKPEITMVCILRKLVAEYCARGKGHTM